MSINSFFQTRKSRSNKNQIESNQKQDASTVASIQAPQPIYDYGKKATVQLQSPPPKQQQQQQQQQQTVCKNSILYYLSPIKYKTENENTTVEESPCRIRTNLPVSSLWKHIIEEFDPDSQSNQFSIDNNSFSLKEEHLLLDKMDISNSHSNPSQENKRRMLQENDDKTRNVRIRTRTSPALLNQTMSLEDYLLEDIGEDLSRPLRMKRTTDQTTDFFLQIIDEVLILSDNQWFLHLLAIKSTSSKLLRG